MEKIYNTGVYPTMITPYKKDGSVDLEKVKEYVKFYYDRGCDGIFAICQSSEIFFLSTEEKVLINKTVYDTAAELYEKYGRKMTIVSSGHTSDSIEDQAKELRAVIDSGTDALVLISNRLDLNNEGDDVWIANAEKLLSMLPEDVKLGVYECPHPYKRLLTPKILKWCIGTDRFKFIKDTCCDAAVIKERLEMLDGSGVMLFNANAQTLLETLRYGASGYSGIMANMHPELYVWLCKNYKSEKADILQSFISTSAFIEGGIPYPLSAKYHMCLEGVETELITRTVNRTFNDYQKSCVEKMRTLAKKMETDIIG